MRRNRGIRENWKEARLNEIATHKETDGKEPFPPYLASWNVAAKWLIVTLAENGLAPKVENLGAGVKRISVEGQSCPTCGRKEDE